jgi:hypothetical protein
MNDRIAGEEELAEIGLVVQVAASLSVGELENDAAREWLAPQQLVISAKRRTVLTRIRR